MGGKVACYVLNGEGHLAHVLGQPLVLAVVDGGLDNLLLKASDQKLGCVQGNGLCPLNRSS